MIIPSGESLFFILTQIIFFLSLVSLLLVATVIIIRLVDLYDKKRKDDFLSKWEKDFYEYLGSPDNPAKLLKEVRRSQYKYLLMVLRDLFSLLSGKDLESLKRIINETPVYNFLLDDLKSKKNKKNNPCCIFFRSFRKSEC